MRAVGESSLKKGHPTVPHKIIGLAAVLLVVADTAAHIANPGYVTLLLNRGRVVRPWKHVLDLTDLTIGFLCRSVEFRAIHLALGVCKAPDILANVLL